MTLLGGLLYAPNNYDALAYRVPRVLHWLAEGQWHWIHTAFPRLNTRSQGCEWMMAPVLLFLRSERIVWLQNFAMFLALPGLVFMFLRGLGVARRVAWHWMWILPSAYCLVLQAGSIGNDLPGAFFVLAAAALAIRARRSGQISDLWLSGLAAAVATGVKVSNAPLLLVWLVAAWPSLPMLGRRPFSTAAVIAVSMVVSFLPMAGLNLKNCGDWSGAVLELGREGKPPAWVLVTGNVLGLTVQNLTPPVFPAARAWNAQVVSCLPEGYRQKIQAAFEGGGENLWVTDLQIEEGAGAGFGVTLLLVLSALVGLVSRGGAPHRAPWIESALRWAPWVALFFLLAKLNIGTVARLATPYYLLISGAILATSGQEWLTRRRWWHWLVFAQFVAAAGLVVVSPARPLWPALTLLQKARDQKPGSALVERMFTVYSVYRARPDVMAPVREAVPASATVIGLVAGDEVETSLWRPFGARRFRHVIRGDTRAQLDAQGVTWLVIEDDSLVTDLGEPLESWLTSLDAELVSTIPVKARATRGTVAWYVARLRSPSAPPHP